ncbi:MAG: hypothetical protein Q9222_007560, partial [Ikaeria aurantiellina]
MCPSPEDLEPSLRHACASGNLPLTTSLLSQLPSTTSLLFPLSSAIVAGQVPITSYLLTNGASLTPLHITQSSLPTARSILMFETFLSHNWDPNSPSDMGSPVLKHVIDDHELVAWLLAHGADANAVPNILDVAAAHASPATFALLVAHGAKIEDSDPLISAAGECENEDEEDSRVEMM